MDRTRGLTSQRAGIKCSERPDQDARVEYADHGRLKGNLYANPKNWLCLPMPRSPRSYTAHGRRRIRMRQIDSRRLTPCLTPRARTQRALTRLRRVLLLSVTESLEHLGPVSKCCWTVKAFGSIMPAPSGARVVRFRGPVVHTADTAEIGLDAPRNHMPYERVTNRREGDVRSLDQLSDCHDDVTRR